MSLEKAALAAIETVLKYNLNPRRTDPLIVLQQMKNVYLIAHDIPIIGDPGANQDAVTLVNKTEDGLQYIVIYDNAIQYEKLRFALTRELAHVILEHDGSSPEETWSAEANCFAYHFLCPLPLIQRKTVNYRPMRFCLSWELKDAITFDSVEEMKAYIANEQTRYNHFIGRTLTVRADDIELIRHTDYDQRIGWSNCYDIVLDGKTVGYCGE